MKRRGKAARSLVVGLLMLALSLTVFFHSARRKYREDEVEVRLSVSLSSLFPELTEALLLEDTFLLDGRFALAVEDCALTPSLLRFYDGTEHLEFTVPSARKKDATLLLTGKARQHSFGYALGGVRTVNVGMNLTLYGERCKIYGRVSAIEVLGSAVDSDFSP